MDVLCKICSIPAELLSKVPGIGPVVKACCTSVGQKILMALTGLALCGFLVAHLAGNLLLFVGEDAFNEYAEKLHSLGPVLWAMEAGLLATFLVHICLAISTAAMSRQARRKKYGETATKQEGFVLSGGGAANFMLPTGFMILLFLVLHVCDMKFNLRTTLGLADFEFGEENLFLHVKQVFGSWLTRGVYVLGLIALGVHLSHGVSSACQTLGISHPRWNGLIRFVGVLFAWGIAAGFLGLVFWGINEGIAAAG